MTDFSKAPFLDGAPTLHFVYRACDAVEACSAEKRCFCVPKACIVSRCLSSIERNLATAKAKVLVHVVEDCCSKETVELLKGTFGSRLADFVSLDRKSNADSFCRCAEMASRLPDHDIVFFCEDDYLFLRDDVFDRMAAAMTEFRRRFGDVGIMPDDYPDRYDHGLARNVDVAETGVGPFMRIFKTTCTFAASPMAVKRNFRALMNFSRWPKVTEDESVNVMWSNTALFHPLPAWTLHCQLKSIVPPYLEYDKIDEYFRAGQ